MPKRIYALAKELSMDSKDLVDLCTKLGILNKGSALASLEDDEVARIEKYLAGSETQAVATEKKVSEPVQSFQRPPKTQMRAIVSIGRSSKKSAAGTATEEPPEVDSQPQTVEDDSSETEPEETQQVQVTKANTLPEAPMRQFSRDDYVAPPSSAGIGRVRSLDAKRGAGSGGAKPEAKRPPQQRRAPVINLASVPNSTPPPIPKPKSNEPAPQRPEIRFTKDDISGQKQGMKAPLKEIEEKQQATKEGRAPAASRPSFLRRAMAD